MRFVTRAEWGARPPKNGHPEIATNKGVKIHYFGSLFVGVEHGQCPRKMRETQSEHMDGNGWADIGYSLAVCQHGYVYEGRGKNAQNSANGNPDLNRDHYAVPPNNSPASPPHHCAAPPCTSTSAPRST